MERSENTRQSLVGRLLQATQRLNSIGSVGLDEIAEYPATAGEIIGLQRELQEVSGGLALLKSEERWPDSSGYDDHGRDPGDGKQDSGGGEPAATVPTSSSSAAEVKSYLESRVPTGVYGEGQKAMEAAGTQAAISYLSGEAPLAYYSDGKFACAVMSWKDTEAGQYDLKGKGLELTFKEGDNRPVPTGKWMDWKEASWGLSDKQYQALSTGDRAALEAKEQVERWVPSQFAKNLAEWYPKGK